VRTRARVEWLWTPPPTNAAAYAQPPPSPPKTPQQKQTGYKPTPQSAPGPAEKRVRLHRLPRVLLLHLCRFEWLAEGGGAAKLHAHLPFPQQLALRPGWLSDDCPDRPRGAGASSGPPRYNLQAVVTHLGKHSHGEYCLLIFERANNKKKENNGCESIAPPFSPPLRAPSRFFRGEQERGGGSGRRARFLRSATKPVHYRGGPTSIANRDRIVFRLSLPLRQHAASFGR
jgi:hypothetical protein